MNRKLVSIAKSLVISLLIVQSFNPRIKERKTVPEKKTSKNKFRKSLMATWEDIDSMSDAEEEEEANLALMTSTSEDIGSDLQYESKSDDEQKVFSNLSRTELVDALNDVAKHYVSRCLESVESRLHQ
jgi:hypothetical protein